FRLTTDTLAVRLMVPTIRVHRGLSPPSQRSTTIVDHTALSCHAPCRAHTGMGLTRLSLRRVVTLVSVYTTIAF
ncbi:MAG TPA: hypothetical protein VFG19_02490, partial [Geobacteraceae bacterium]|nr:hypothetical protein [Geobacteraceae bacterium]